MRIAISKYEPYVDCDPNPSLAPSEESCAAVLELVPSFDKLRLFAVTADPRFLGVRLPRDFYISRSLRPV